MSEADEKFKALANAQRDKPERAMLRAQKVLGEYPSGNTLGWIMEHVGDLTHRMTEYGASKKEVRYSKEFVAPKVSRGLNAIRNPIDRDNMSKIPDLPELRQYSSEHAKLPAYNHAHAAARDAAIALGKKDFDTVDTKLSYLHNLLRGDDAFENVASKYNSNYDDPQKTFAVYHGSPHSDFDQIVEHFKSGTTKHRTGTPGTLSFTTSPSVAEIYGPHLHKAEVTGNFGNYQDPKHVEKVFDWRDKSALMRTVYRRVEDHFRSQGPEITAIELQKTKDKLRKEIESGQYSLWENTSLWRDLGWHGAWTKEHDGHNLIVGKDAIIKKVSNQ